MLNAKHTGIHQKNVYCAGQQTENKYEEHDHLVHGRFGFADAAGKQQQEDPADDSDRRKSRQLQVKGAIAPQLEPVHINQPGTHDDYD